MSDIYRHQRERFIASIPRFANLFPTIAPNYRQELTITPPMARQLFASAANNHASLLILLGWGNGSWLDWIATDTVLANKQVVVFLFDQETDDFAATFRKDQGHILGSDRIRMLYVKTVEDIAQAISAEFGDHQSIPRLAGCDTVDTHPLNSLAMQAREELAPIIYKMLGDRPQSYGNDIMDTFTGIHNASYNANIILPAPRLEDVKGYFGQSPVISIGGGPSLSGHLPALRELQDRCVLIAADSTCPGLLAEGIMPHFVTPIERLQATTDLVQCLHDTDTWFAGMGVVPREAVDVFKGRALGVFGGDALYDWLTPEPGTKINTGSSTGVLSCNVGTVLSRGPVYLVGHDLCRAGDASHWAGNEYSATLWKECKDKSATSSALNGYEDRWIPGNNGELVKSIAWWDRFREELSHQAVYLKHLGRPFYNVNAHTGVGAVIPGTAAAPLPKRDNLQPLTPFQPPPPDMRRLEQWQERARNLSADAERYCSTIKTLKDKIAKKMASTHPDRWSMDAFAQELNTTSGVSKGNQLAFAYFLRSALHNHSAEMHYRRRTHHLIQSRQVIMETMLNLCHTLVTAVEKLRPTMEEIEHDCC